MMHGSYINGRSKIAGGVSEVALMTPIIPGRIPGERRTYEERLRAALANTQARAEQGLPSAVLEMPSIHFARWIIIRPEHYLLHSNLQEVTYYDDLLSKQAGPETPNVSLKPVPKPIDAYLEGQNQKTFHQTSRRDGDSRGLRSWLMTLILFDGDVQVYGREIAAFVEGQVDRIFENCEDYPHAKNYSKWWQWFRRYQLTTDVFYNACPDLSVARIKELERFKAKFDEFIAAVRPHNRRVEGSTDALLDEFIRSTQTISSGFPSAGGVYKDEC